LPPPAAADDTGEAALDDGDIDPDATATAVAVVADGAAVDAGGAAAFELLLPQPLRTLAVTTVEAKVAATLRQGTRRA